MVFSSRRAKSFAARERWAVVMALLLGMANASQAQDGPQVRILNASPYAIAADPELSDFVSETAQAAIAEHCASCHGGDRDSIYDVMANGRLGECPPWGGVLDAATIKALAVYIWNTSRGL